jgi:hypothetical protein
MSDRPTAPALDRGHLLGGMAATAALGAAPALGKGDPGQWVRPVEAGWPGAKDWAALGRAVGGRLAPGGMPEPVDETRLGNPYYLRDQPGLTQSSGRIDG